MATPLKYQKAIEEYIQYWETLTPRSIRLIEKISVMHFRFRDPFHDLQGHDAFEKMLAQSFERSEKISFKTTDVAWGRDAQTAYLRWIVTITTKKKHQTITLEGMSEVSFDENGMAVNHIDHWDSTSQLFAKLPLIGGLFRWLLQKAAS
jgi:hypothetical protein